MGEDVKWNEFLHEAAVISDLTEIGALLSWDQDTFMPPGGGEGRGHQFATLSSIRHERITSSKTADLLAELSERDFEEGSPEAGILRVARRAHERATKLPARLVEELARRSSTARMAWAQAREAKDYSLFEPELAAVFELKREEADAIGYEGERYDALLDEYEPGATAAELRELFEPLRSEQVELAAQIAESAVKPDMSPLQRGYGAGEQAAYLKALVAEVGYDFRRGRLDTTIHPFATSMGIGDVRMTTRYQEGDLAAALFGTLHEMGHALYEQGIDPAYARTPLASGVSLGVHESQSRLWENLVGRSLAFWEGAYQGLKAAFPQQLGNVSTREFHAAVNGVQRDLIRIEADEVTYNLHVLVRFELEQALLSDDLAAKDLPGTWNERYEQYLGVTPGDDVVGCMQDIHWSVGLVGYFPTYTLGNLMSVQFWEAAGRAIGDIDEELRAKRYAPLLNWLSENVYTHGSRFQPADLLKRATGQALSADPYLNYLKGKYRALYQLS